MWGRGGSLIHDLAYFDCRWDFECLPFAGIIDELLADGEEINARDETGCTPLLNACYLGCSSQFIKLLISKGADLNAVDSGGWSALHQVLYKASVNCERYGGGQKFQARDYLTATGAIRTLLVAGCRLDILPKDGQSCADLARFPCIKRMWNNALSGVEVRDRTRWRIQVEEPRLYSASVLRGRDWPAEEDLTYGEEEVMPVSYTSSVRRVPIEELDEDEE